MRQFFSRFLPIFLITLPAFSQTGAPLFPSDPTSQFRLQGLGPENWTVLDVSGQPFSRVWRLKTPYPSGTGNPYDFFLTGAPLLGIEKGDLLLATVWVRSISAVFGQAHTRFVVQEDQSPYQKSAEWFLSAGQEWKRFQIPFRAAKTNAAGTYSVQFWISYGPQEIEIAGLQLVNYGPAAKVKDLALSGYPYEGFAVKSWKPDAESRIENQRKGDAVVVFRDDNGKLLANTDVEIRMKAHQFGFGTAVQSAMLLSADAGAAAYRQTFLANFNRATPENDLKWTEWITDRDRALRGLDWLQTNGIKQVRGHNLVWPGWQYLPGYLRALSASPSALQTEIDRHIAEEAAAAAGKVSEWDVLNEPVTNTDLQKILGNPVMAAWFKTARAADAQARLYVNDYNLLEGGGNDTPHQAGFDSVMQALDGAGAGVQGIGLQAHMQWQLTDPVRMYELLNRYAAYKRDLQITEFDVDVEDPDLQAEYLSDFLTVAFSHPALSGVTLWGFWEGNHFRPNAALWRNDWSPKPAAQAWRDLVYKKWWTNVQARSDADGVLRFRGFGGNYEALVTVDGVRQTIPFTLRAGQTNYILLGKPPAPKLAASAVLHGASFAAGAVSPGQIIAVFGSDFGTAELASAQFDAAGKLPLSVGDVSVLVDGKPAEMLYAVHGQAGAVLPVDIRGTVRLQLGFLGQPSNEIYLPVADANPGIFTRSGGAGPAAAINAGADTPNSATSPVARGDILTFFVTGLGKPDNAGTPSLQPRVLFGDREAEILFAGRILPGVYQLNARVPQGSPLGEAVPLSVTAGAFKSQAGTTISVR
ncbi:MAG TPA: endo-1,4-beta-xylanase [Bryobacteraceae bacterium]|nr:endo-1,4-beta-xylanase [Bryobacteraceae bacterium]